MTTTWAMAGSNIVVDGLWRCLCPSVDLAYLSKPINLSRLPRRQSCPPLAHRCVPSQSQRQQCRRQYHALSPRLERQVQSLTSTDKARIAYLKRLAKRNPWVPGAIFLNPDAIDSQLDEIPTRLIYAALKELQSAEETFTSIVRLVEYLVKKRGEQPNAALYEALIKANVNKKYGSAKVAGQLLKEMETNNIPTTPEIYNALLEVTAVHPDYILRSRVLHDMKIRWYGVTPSAKVSIIVGFLRDGQYEHALAKLEELNAIPLNVPPWLLDIFLYTFGELGFHEEALAILKYREGVISSMKRAPVSLNTWQFLLEVFSRDVYQPGVRYVWYRSVTRGFINPPDGVVLSVLNAASKQSDSGLAMSAIELLSRRGTKLRLQHYEPLIQIYLDRNDLHRTLTLLCIMAKGGLSPDLSSTRPIYLALRDSPTSTERALKFLHQLKWQYTVPPAAFNLVLELTVAQKGFKVAFDLYRIIRQVCINGPDLETFELMFRECTERRSMNFLMAEMEAFSFKPTKSIFDQLIRICTLQEDYGIAFRYLKMMKDCAPPDSPENWWISKGPALGLLRRCIQARDPRYEELLKECQSRGLLFASDIKALMALRNQETDADKKASSSPSTEQESSKALQTLRTLKPPEDSEDTGPPEFSETSESSEPVESAGSIEPREPSEAGQASA